MSERAFFRRRITDPLVAQLKQGVEPAKLAWSAALGFTLSLLPVPGATTALCAIAAFALGLNPVAIQVANFAAAPLQLLLFVPFVQLGQMLFGEPPVPLAPAGIRDELARGALRFLTLYGEAIGRGTLIWLLAAPVISFSLQLALRPLLERFLRALRLRKEERDRLELPHVR